MNCKTIWRVLTGAAALVALTMPGGAGAGNPPRPAIFHGLPAAQRDAAPEAHREARHGARHSDVKVSWFKFNGPTAVNEALISGNVDVGSGGVPGLLHLWSRTKGTPQEVRGISALSSQPFLLNTTDPAIKTIKDFKDSDRIAVPAVKSSVQAITLQMAAAKE